MSYPLVKRRNKISAYADPRKFRTGYGCIPLNTEAFTSDRAKQHHRFAAVSEQGYVCKWVTDCSLSEFEFIAWLYLRDQLDCGLRWRVFVRWPKDNGLLEQNELQFRIGFSIEEQEDFERRLKDREALRSAVYLMYIRFWKCFYKHKICKTKRDVAWWMGNYPNYSEWIKTKVPLGGIEYRMTGKPLRRPLKLKLPSTCLLLEQSGRTSRYVCLGFQSSDSMCQTFMSSSPAERASILKLKGTSTPKLG